MPSRRRVATTLPIVAGLMLIAAQTALAAPGGRDTTFSGDGVAETSAGTGSERGNAIVVHNNKIVVAGYAYNGTTQDIAVARFLSNGTPDATFAGDGSTTTNLGANEQVNNALAVFPDDSILVAGLSYNSSTSRSSLFLVKYQSNGTRDPNFGGGDGVVTTNFGKYSAVAYDLVVLPSGKIAVAGSIYSDSQNGDMALFRFNSNGSPDTSFGGGKGYVTFNFGPGFDEGWRLLRQDDGKYLMAGWVAVDIESGYDGGLVRFNSDGTLDTTFGLEGSMTYNPTRDPFEYINGMAIYGGKIYACFDGTNPNNSSNYDITIMRLKMNGARDRTFGPGGDGEVEKDFGQNEQCRDIAFDSAGRLLVVGARGSSWFIARFNAAGAPDTTFGSNGIQTAAVYGEATSLAFQADNKIVVSGVNGSTQNMAAARFLP